MRGKGRREPRANHLQPEGHLRPSGQIAVAQHLLHPTADHKTVANPLPDRGHRRRLPHMHCYRALDLAAQ